MDSGSVSESYDNGNNVAIQTTYQFDVTPDASDPAETATVWVNTVDCNTDWAPCFIPVSITAHIINSCPTPTITGIKRSTWFAGKTYDNVVITGTNFITNDKATASCPVTAVSITAADGSTVPVSNVRVESKTKITLSVSPPVSDPTDPTETATVTVGKATFNPAYILGNQILCDPSMNCTPTVISTTDGSPPPVQNVVVGQPIILTTNPNLPITPYKTTWTVGGTRIKNYAPSTAPTSVTELKDDDLKNPNINFFWVYQKTDNIPVTYIYCAHIPDVGDQCSPVATASFNLSGPGDAQMTTDPYSSVNIDMLIDQTPCLPTSADKDPYMQYGQLTGYDDIVCQGPLIGDAGIIFTPPAATSSGKYSFVQIVTGDKVTYSNGTSSGAFTTIPGLDGKYPYPPWSDGRVADAPASVLRPTDKRSSRTFNATMYLLWTSSMPNSIPVPIGSQKWKIAQARTTNPGYPTNQSWTQPVWNVLGTDGDPIDYVQTAPSQTPYGYPTWKGLATPVWFITEANETDQEEEQ